MFLQVLVVMMVAVFQSQAQYSQNGWNSNSRGAYRMARCALPTIPCRLKFEMSTGGTLTHSSDSQTCSCNGHQRCSQDWNQSDRAISRNLVSANMNVTLSMMFCNTVQPRVNCTDGDISLEVSGFLTIPNDLENYNCRCENSSGPLQLKERGMNNGRFYHKYICDEFKTECAAGQACQTMRSDRTEYNCGCPTGSSCHISGTWTAHTRVMHGYCTAA